jgi:SNF2 family DNA or RNA helicase
MSGIRDNHDFGKVGDFLKEKIQPNAQLRFVSAYFSIFGFEALKAELLPIDKLQFLFGEPTFVKQLDVAQSQAKAFHIVEQDLWLNNRLNQKAIAKTCANWITKKVEIRSLIQTNLLHGKLYHINNNGVESALLGSSNFTLHGLGDGNSNIELNLVVDSDRDRQDLKSWFDGIWNNKTLVKDVKQEVLNYLTQLYYNHSPQFIYYKTLYHVFYEDWQRYQEQREATEKSLNKSEIWNTLFDFQKEGVTHAITKIQAHNGCILADRVGLGKTYEALAVIKYFEAKHHNVLVLCPKKLSENWLLYSSLYKRQLNPLKADKLNYTVLSHTDLSREKGLSNNVDLSDFEWSQFDLIVIDESHNFRNDNKSKNGKSRYQRLLEDVIQAGEKTKVLLLSATPVNNDLSDLYNQIRFISADDTHAFADIGIVDTKKTLRAAQNAFHDAVKNKRQSHTHLANYLHADFFKLLDAITIARSRKHIERHYPNVAKELGGFPKRTAPQSIYYDMDTLGVFPSFVGIEKEISAYQLSLFNPTKYLLNEYRDLPEYQSKVKNFTQENREHYLIGMMKVNFLKRLESSVVSFADTMARTVIKIEDLIKKIKQLDEIENLIDDDSDDEELNDALAVGKKIKFKLKHLDCERWLQDLENDKEQLKKLRDTAQNITSQRDGKLHELKKLITHKITNPTVDKQGKSIKKVLIFTAFSDTAQYLYNALKSDLTELGVHSGLVTGSKCEATLGMTNFNDVLINFSPTAKKRSGFKNTLTDEIDILIATDCISEGQNLQDCDWVINYDIHWNPVRLIQRFGRIDRINSQNKDVSMINFWATAELDQYLNLKNRVEARMALVDISATGSDNLLLTEDDANDELNYRDEQLKRMKDEVLDLEELNDGATLTDFNFDDFRADLGGYLDLERDKLANAPLGLYGIVPEQPDLNIHKGVIFCLQQKVYQQEKGQQVNPLTPFFLIYIQDDGKVRRNFVEAKHTLEIFKMLCIDKDEPYEALCQLFDDQTSDGSDMTHYYDLVAKSVDAISEAFQEKEIIKLATGRGALLPVVSEQITNPTDFTLVTWLVIS